MSQQHNINLQEETNIKKVYELFIRNFRIFIAALFITLIFAFGINRYSIPIYNISSSILIKEDNSQTSGQNINDYLNSSLFGRNINFQNELWVLKSTPVIERTIQNLGLELDYYTKGRIQSFDGYKEVPFKVAYEPNHPQPINVKFSISFYDDSSFLISAKSKNASFYNFEKNELTYNKEDWEFSSRGRIGELIEDEDISFIIQPYDTSIIPFKKNNSNFEFMFRSLPSINNEFQNNLEFKVVDRAATVIEISLKSESVKKGLDFVNELMNVYSQFNLERKNHLANITIDYIEQQLSEISDSLSQTENSLQSFRSANQLLSVTDQAAGISAQHLNLQDQLAELVSRKRYYDYVVELLANDNFSNMMLPATIGISDQILNSLMSELINAQAQRTILVQNNQERNPQVQKLNITINNLKKTISDNVEAVSKTTNISIDEMNKRIRKIEAEINKIPATQRKLGIIERKYRLNDAIYNYLMEKHAEAKITKASNLPDDIIIEPANLVGLGPVTPNKPMNYLAALLLGFVLPFAFFFFKDALNTKIQGQDDVEKITSSPMLGKIMHNRYKTNNVMFEFPKSNIAESIRALRTNLDFYVRGGQKKVIMVSSCFEGEGKSFTSLNLAMSYAQLGRRTILLDFDLRKPKTYFSERADLREGLSSYFIYKSDLEDIILKSPHEKLDYIPSGILPPNPGELLSLETTEELISKLKERYDVIVLDTTPLAQVTDAYLLINNAEVTVIVIRQNYTVKSVFSLIMKDLRIKNIHNICIVMNDNRYYQDQYGYGYGYYSKKGLFKKKKELSKSVTIPPKAVKRDIASV